MNNWPGWLNFVIVGGVNAFNHLPPSWYCLQLPLKGRPGPAQPSPVQYPWYIRDLFLRNNWGELWRNLRNLKKWRRNPLQHGWQNQLTPGEAWWLVGRSRWLVAKPPIAVSSLFPALPVWRSTAGGYHSPRGSLPFVRNRNDQVGCFSPGTNGGAPRPLRASLAGPRIRVWRSIACPVLVPLLQGLPISLASPRSASFKWAFLTCHESFGMLLKHSGIVLRFWPTNPFVSLFPLRPAVVSLFDRVDRVFFFFFFFCQCW